jgi:hypothetical protein
MTGGSPPDRLATAVPQSTKFKGDEHECCVGDIYTMRPDGSHRKPVPTSPKFE